MVRVSMMMSVLVAMLALICAVSGLNNGLALLPPLGFNSYLSDYDSEAGLLRVAEFLVTSGLHAVGYRYINSDEGWELPSRDSHGRLQPNDKFPSGIPNLVQKLRSIGNFSLGLYIASSGVTCGQNSGSLHHEDVDAETFASWGVEYVKSDNCASYALDPSVRFGALRDAVHRTGWPMLLSIEPFSIAPDPLQSIEVANLARVYLDIRGVPATFLQRADVADKWAPLAQPGYWNDPDIVYLSSPSSRSGPDDLTLPSHTNANHRASASASRLALPAGGLSIGENRLYFGLWALMKAPILLGGNIESLPSAVLDIARNAEVLAVHQDSHAVGGRKLTVSGQPIPWLSGTADCGGAARHNYNRPFSAPGEVSTDPRAWDVLLAASGAPAPASSTNSVPLVLSNRATRRCLAAVDWSSVSNVPRGNSSAAQHTVALLPCNFSSDAQRWYVSSSLSTPTSFSIVRGGLELALTMSNGSLFSSTHNGDALPLPGAAYNEEGLTLTPRRTEEPCTTRNCEDYFPEQMWYYSPADGFLRQSTYVASLNHIAAGMGYRLTPKLPTWRHHCLSHVLSVFNSGTASASIETWAVPLTGNRFAVGLVNRGPSGSTIPFEFVWLGVPGVGASTRFVVRDLWQRTTLGNRTGGVAATVGAMDMALLLLS